MPAMDEALARKFDDILGPWFLKKDDRDWLVIELCSAVDSWIKEQHNDD